MFRPRVARAPKTCRRKGTIDDLPLLPRAKSSIPINLDVTRNFFRPIVVASSEVQLAHRSPHTRRVSNSMKSSHTGTPAVHRTKTRTTTIVPCSPSLPGDTSMPGIRVMGAEVSLVSSSSIFLFRFVETLLDQQSHRMFASSHHPRHRIPRYQMALSQQSPFHELIEAKSFPQANSCKNTRSVASKA